MKSLLILAFNLFIFSGDKVSVHSSGIHYVEQADLKLKDPSASQVLTLKACATTTDISFFLFLIVHFINVCACVEVRTASGRWFSPPCRLWRLKSDCHHVYMANPSVYPHTSFKSKLLLISKG